MATKEEILESISNMSVMDLVDLISDIEEKFGVTAAAVAAAPVAAGAGAVDMEGEGMRPPEPEPEVSENGEPVPLEPGEGVLELHPNGYGFLRSPENHDLSCFSFFV